MLQAIRDRAQGIFAWIILILICVPFALWGIQNYMDSGKESPVAVVGDRDIFERDVNRVYEQSLASLVGLEQYDEAGLKREALNRLVRDEVISQTAVDNGFVISEDDIKLFVQTLPYFQTDNKFDKEKYKLMLSSQGMSTTQFFAQIRKALAMEQLQRGINDTGIVTQQQIDAFYRLRNQERQIEYITIPFKKYEGEISNDEIQAYYNQNHLEFQNPETISVEYLALTMEQVAATIKPTEDEIKALYEEQKNQFTTAERRRVSHILIATDTDQADADKLGLEKARQIHARLLNGEDFAKLAKEYSEDKASAQNSGDLGFISNDAMEPNFAKAAFALSKGDISEPVKTSFGYHVIKVMEIEAGSTKPFEAVRAELANSLQRSAAENKFYELAQTLTEQSFEHPDSLEPASKILGLKVQETEPFSRDSGTGIAAENLVRDAAFKPEVIGGKNSEPVEIGNDKVYVLRVKEHRPTSAKPMDQVKSEIVDKLRDRKARAEVRERAEKLLSGLKPEASLTDVAKSVGLTLNQPPAFRRNTDKLPIILVETVFKLPRPVQAHQGKVQTLAIENGDQVIFRVLSVQDGTTQGVETKELNMAKEYIQKNVGQDEFTAFVEQLRRHADVYIKPQQQ